MLVIILGVILVSIILFIVVVFINSTGKLPQLKDTQGKVIKDSISEKVWIEVNGIKQGMFIRGENKDNPIVLYLHGGPGTPMLQFVTYLENDERLEKDFTVCYWDQRGSGMTYSKTTDPSTMTVDQMVEDTKVVTEYLKERFGQEKIYLIGHSWGSYLGVKVAERYPEDYFAYVGIGQVTDQTKSERLAYDYMLNHAKDINDKEIINKLEPIDINEESFPNLNYLVKVRTGILNRYKIGHLHQGLKTTDMLKALFVFKGYTISEKIKWFRGADFSMVHLFPVVLSNNLFESSMKFEIPFYIVQGDYDYQVSQVLAEQYLNTITAPKKEYFSFNNSAHSPNMEEMGKFVKVFQIIGMENS
ncbi:alpha/beta hydrolase [Breznakia pachnodae]|uniref:prolyl aminopeptidase n=1 Tax=Breznakia pachnodae TaxID=265178 RepID=A0ABU0E884_9FIRM|nr:alpha/beta fold hydrolase [Breznakia pachnodae]MDQ0363030.1 pimeloyl-ACP methyl ester carboxylesterase [Breznakia pachnodae]